MKIYLEINVILSTAEFDISYMFVKVIVSIFYLKCVILFYNASSFEAIDLEINSIELVASTLVELLYIIGGY